MNWAYFLKARFLPMTEDEVEDETVDEAVVQIGGGERHFLEDTITKEQNYKLGVIFDPVLSS